MFRNLSSQQLRHTMQMKRLALSQAEQQQAAHHIFSQAIDLIRYYQPTTVAFYLPVKGEISPLQIMNHLQTQKIRCLLPALHPFTPHYLQFFQYTSPQDLTTNRFGILEPKKDIRTLVPFTEIELIFVPLVACDKQNNRLGMGGGFYDRTLAQMPNTITVGLAHHCQLVEQLPTENWDIPLKHILFG